MCAPGYVTAACSACALGSYSTGGAANAAKCVKCDTGYTTPTPASISVGACQPECPKGTVLVGSTCQSTVAVLPQFDPPEGSGEFVEEPVALPQQVEIDVPAYRGKSSYQKFTPSEKQKEAFKYKAQGPWVAPRFEPNPNGNKGGNSANAPGQSGQTGQTSGARKMLQVTPATQFVAVQSGDFNDPLTWWV